jgi:pimeloyl-ACP methyl ester carboxylesterase
LAKQSRSGIVVAISSTRMDLPMRRRLLATIATVALLATALAALFEHEDPFLLGLLRYAAWRKFSPDAGTKNFAEVNGVRLYYEDHGSGMPILVLHGGSGFVEMMGGQIPALAKHHRVIAVDSRGHGRSTDGPPPLRYETMADDMMALLDELGIDHYDVVGWSDGGNIALALAMAQPERVERVVAIGANARADGVIDDPEDDLEEEASEPEEVPPFRPLHAFVIPDNDHLPELLGELHEMWRTQPQWSDAELGRIRARTLLLVGENDVIKPEHTREIAAAIPHARVETIPGATHGLPLERPNLVAARIVEFLDAP